MSVESLKRVLLKIKDEARAMRKAKYAKRLAPPPKTEAVSEAKPPEGEAKG